jgi:hypothetical protein
MPSGRRIPVPQVYPNGRRMQAPPLKQRKSLSYKDLQQTAGAGVIIGPPNAPPVRVLSGNHGYPYPRFCGIPPLSLAFALLVSTGRNADFSRNSNISKIAWTRVPGTPGDPGHPRTPEMVKMKNFG